MNNFTYEKEDRVSRYETYEWDNLWIEHADDETKTRVLYIGDSISCGIRQLATAATGEEILFDGFGTSKGIDNPFFKDSLKVFAAQQGYRQAVIFNNGLHGWHLTEDEYAVYYEDMIKFIVEEFKGTPIAVVLSTHLDDPAREKRIAKRNESAKEIAEKYGLPVIDLYDISLKNANLLSEDKIHFTQDGYKLFAGEIIKSVKGLII